MKTINAELADELMFGCVGEEIDGCKIVEQSEWTQEHKYQYMYIVFEFDGKFYSLSRSRSGSYHSDWHYDSEYEKEFRCPEVEKVEKVVYEWVSVK